MGVRPKSQTQTLDGIRSEDNSLPEAAMLARHANPRVTLAVYAGLTDGAREVAADKLLSAGFGA